MTYLSNRNEPSWTIVRRRSTRASSIWDHIHRVSFDFAHEEINPTRIAKPLRVTLRTQKRAKRTVATLVLEDVRGGTFSHELIFEKGTVPAALARSFCRLLYGGPSCHEDSGLPMSRLEELGCLLEASMCAGEERVAISRLVVERIIVVDVSGRDFAPPRGFSRVDKGNRAAPAGPDADSQAPRTSPNVFSPPSSATRISVAASGRRALFAEREPTPRCLESTRTGSMAAVLHQDALDHTVALINSASALLGTATLNGGALTVNWLAALAAIGSPTAAGSGLFCFLRSPRKPATAMGPASGGAGVLDCLAMKNLVEPDESGLSRLQREAATGALNSTMRGWGITSTAMISDLFAVGGDLTRLPINEQIAIVEAYETSELGMFRLSGFPYETDEFVAELAVGSHKLQFLKGKLWSLTGTMNFASLGGAPLIPAATIGSSGNIVITIAIPTTTLKATATWQLLLQGVIAANVVSALLCLLVPLSCGLVPAITTALMTFLNRQLSVVTATARGAGLTFDISYQWDAAANVLNPVVSLVTRTGSITVVPSWMGPIPNAIQVMVESVLAGTLNAMNVWTTAVGLAATKAIETNLRAQGLGFPFGASGLGLTAVSGSARSASGTSLTLMAEVGPTQITSSQPYVTQVVPVDELATQLEMSQAAMRGDIVTSTTPAPAADSYGALAVSQNALNYYVYSQWLEGSFTLDITDGQVIARLVDLLPKGTFARTITRIHVWPAVSPRVEIAQQALTAQQRSLLITMDDVRVCFEALGPWTNDMRQPVVVCELIANLKVAGTLTLEWPLVPRLRFDSRAPQIVDQRVWEVVDPNQPPGTSTQTAQWDLFVEAVGAILLAPYDASTIGPPPTPLRWRNPIPSGIPQELIRSIQAPPLAPQSLYMDVLAQRRALYLLPVLRTAFIELVNGSGAPTLNLFLGATGVTVSSMTCAQGTRLRRIVVGASLQQYVFPGP